MPLPDRRDFVVRGAYVVTMDATLGDLTRGDIHVRNGEIVAVGQKLDAAGAEIIDGDRMIALPGLIDTHWHMWGTALRSSAGDRRDGGYFAVKAALARDFKPQDVYCGVRLAAAEALHAGITTVHDWCHNVRDPSYADADLRALEETGIRARFSYGYNGDQPLDRTMDLDDLQRVQREWPSRSKDGLLTLGAAMRGVTCAPEVHRREWEAARSLGLPITVHADSSRRQPHGSEIEAMFREGMLGRDVQVVHANNATPAAIDFLARTGTSVSLSPQTEMRIGFGFPLTVELLAAGVLVSLSVDTTMLAGNADMFGIMKATVHVANARAEDEFKLPARRALELATINGARALGIADRAGSLTPGKRADLILVSTAELNMTAMSDPVSLLVEAAQPSNVDTVVVDGRILKRWGKLCAMDAEEVMREARQSASGRSKSAT